MFFNPGTGPEVSGVSKIIKKSYGSRLIPTGTKIRQPVKLSDALQYFGKCPGFAIREIQAYRGGYIPNTALEQHFQWHLKLSTPPKYMPLHFTANWGGGSQRHSKNPPKPR